MQLVEVTISGFKSFAHKTTFQLSQGLTAVIGPNGSGKSNFTEAIRWVLGEQSLKTLRGKKSEDVIFAGNAAHPRSSSATVTLTFNNEQGRLPIDTPEVALSRRLTRSGESEYLLNGDPVRLIDVQHLLAQAGMGTKSYTVISQGTVDRYLNASPAARRELFDEACGIKPLQLKVSQATRQLTQAENEMEQLRIIVRELEPRLRVLKRQVQREAERTTIAEKFSSAQATWFHHEWHKKSTTTEQAKQTLEKTHAQITEARYQRDLVEQELLAAATHSAPTEASAVSQLTQKAAHAKASYMHAHAQYEAAQLEYTRTQESVHTMQVQLQRAEAELAQARIRLADVSLFGSLRALLGHCADFVSSLLDGTTPTREELKELRTAITTLLEQSSTERGDVRAAQTLVQHLEGPLQAVARLQALLNERTTRLATLSLPQPPSRDDWDATEHALKAYQKNAGSVDQGSTQEERLARARANELSAEREASTAQAMYEQAQAATTLIQTDILRERGSKFLEYVQYTPPPTTIPLRHDELQALARQLSTLGEIDPLAAREYEEVQARYTHVAEQLDDLETTMQKLRQLIGSLTQQMHRQFRSQFIVIQESFETYFKELFGGGEAQLVIVETATSLGEDSSEQQVESSVEGIEIFVHPPGKKLQHIQLLSGGEKALTSLALILAILAVQQPPFLVLDEVDAALDEANSHRFASLLKEKSGNTQCIVVSHNRETMAQADILYGITMQQDGVSKAYSIQLAELVGETTSV